MIPETILDAFGPRWSWNYPEHDLLSSNVRALVDDLNRAETLVRLYQKIAATAAPESTPAPAPQRTTELPAALAKSPAVSALHQAADGSILWPVAPGRPFISQIAAFLREVANPDKQEFARRMGIVIAARRRMNIWPCRDGRPLDSMGLFFNAKTWAALSKAACQVREEIAR